MMVGGASAFDHAHRMRGRGEGDVRVEWPGLMRFKRSFTDPVPANNEQRYREKGIDAFNGPARFTGPNTLEVDGQTLHGKHILIAVGAEPAPLRVRGEDHLIDNEGFLQLDELPSKIVLVGGGYIAAEFSHITARTGAQVTIVQHGDRLLKGFDPDLVSWLMQAFESQGSCWPGMTTGAGDSYFDSSLWAPDEKCDHESETLGRPRRPRAS